MSDVPDAVAELVSEFQKKQAEVGPSAVASNLALMVGLSVVTVLAFNILRPRNRIIYEPKVKYHEGDKQPPRIDNGFFAWLPPVMHTKEPELLDKIGLDAVTFLRFLRMMRWLFVSIAAITCAVLIPINVSYNLSHNIKGRTLLSMLTVQDVKGQLLFIHVAATYVITFLVMGFTWFHWREMVRLRHRWFRSDEYTKSFYARTLMVMHVPRKLQSDQGLQSLFDSLKVPYPTTAVHIGRRVGQLPDLMEYHNQAVRDLEQVLVRYLKGGKVGAKRPTITLGGFLGVGGKTVDTIDYYTAKIQKTETAIEEWRNNVDKNKAENYGFASMAAVPYAHVVANMLAGKKKKGTVITLAPNPKDIIWKNIVKSDAARAKDRTIGFIILGAVCFFYTIPLAVISLLANLTAVSLYVPFLQSWSDNSQWSFTIVSGVLPPTISALFNFFLPRIMRALSKYQGDLTRSRLDRAVVARYFGFLIISQLLIFTLIGVAYQSVTTIVLQIGKHQDISKILRNLSKLPGQIQNTYIAQSSYWLTFFPLRGFLALFDLAQLVNLLWLSIKTHLFGRTPRDIREWTQPPSFEYAIYYSSMLFMGAVALVYAPLAPLVPLMAAAVFWVSSIVYKYQLMFVFVSKVESGGRLWNVVINRLLVSTIFMQLLMVLTIGLVHGWLQYLWVSVVPPIIIIFIFKMWLTRTFDRQFRYHMPDESEIAASKIHSERADARGGRLEKRFGHPALHEDLFTPMVHAKMAPLLREVYHGRLGQQQAGLSEYGGQKVNAAVTPGGLKIAAIEQNDLAYDPALYARDRGEADSDARSIASTTLLDQPRSNKLQHSSSFYASDQRPRPPGFESYMTHGASGSNIELNRLDYNQTTDNLPLLSHEDGGHISRYESPGNEWSQGQQHRSQYGNQPLPPAPMHTTDAYRSAPTHRPPPVSQQSSGGGGTPNMAGRGAGGRPQW